MARRESLRRDAPGRGDDRTECATKVGILCENYFPTLGGEQEHIVHLRRHLESPGDGAPPVEVRVIVPRVAYTKWHGPADDSSVIRPARSWRIQGRGSESQITLTPAALPALKQIFARERFDLLHIHAPCDLGLPSWALWAFKGPTVGTLHSYWPPNDPRRILAPWYRHVMRRMTRVIAVSEAARETMARHARFDCTIIGNGVDCDMLETGRPDPRFADGMRNILTLGRLEPRNGIDIVIEAFGLLATERADVRLLVGGDGPFRAQYEAQVRRLPAHVADRIVFLGTVYENRVDLYASAHCLALGARWSSFSILLLEALAASLKVAALPAGGADRAGAHWALANMARSDSAADYAEVLDRSLEPSTPAEIARAREMARRFDWRGIVPRIRQVYEQALGHA